MKYENVFVRQITLIEMRKIEVFAGVYGIQIKYDGIVFVFEFRCMMMTATTATVTASAGDEFKVFN